MKQTLGFLLVTDVTTSHSTDVKSATSDVRLFDGARSATIASMSETAARAVCVILRKIVPHFPSIFLCLEPTVGPRWQAFALAPVVNQAPTKLARPL